MSVLSLSPEKLLVVLIVALVLVGPDKLPRLARQLGAGWARLRDLHQRFEEELRQSVPDLPSTQEIARIARSPLSMLSTLADLDKPVQDEGARRAVTPSSGETWPADPDAPVVVGTYGATGTNGHDPSPAATGGDDLLGRTGPGRTEGSPGFAPGDPAMN